jgi:hypothetical protein
MVKLRSNRSLKINLWRITNGYQNRASSGPVSFYLCFILCFAPYPNGQLLSSTSQALGQKSIPEMFFLKHQTAAFLFYYEQIAVL